MSNGKELLGDLEFNRTVKEMGDRELLEFVAQQTLEQSKDLAKVSGRLEKTDKCTIINRTILLALIVILSSLGIINTFFLPLF
jgi:hypothetical protein